MSRVALEQVAKTFPGPGGQPIPALRDLSLSAAPGERLVLLGPSGSGKTTVLRLIAGLEAPDSGRVRLDGQDQAGVPPQDRDLGMVFQQAALYPHLSVRDNLRLGLRLRRHPAADMERRLQDVAARLRLESLLDRHPAALSGGEARRVALGRALMRQPRVLLLDEPLSQLDAPLRTQLRADLAALPRASGPTLIHVTHDQAEALALADRIAVLAEGRLQQAADPETLYREPANVFVAGFVGSPPMNLWPGRLHREGSILRFEPAGGGMRWTLPSFPAAMAAARDAADVVLGLRPEHLRVAGQDAGPEGWRGRVTDVSVGGAETVLTVSAGELRCAVRWAGWPGVRAGDDVRLEPDWTGVRFFDGVTGVAWSAAAEPPP